ncbi:carboxymuconolactone decarboxylase family protein [Flindersiella endophytica]
MRLAVLDHGHRLRARLFMSMVGRMSRVEMADVPKTLLYRPEFFGRAMLELSATRMRGPSYWTAAEREYIGMCTAGWLRSDYCAETHAEMVRVASDGEFDPLDPTAARKELLAVLAFLEQVTRTPDAVQPRDADTLRDAGVPHEAVVQALEVNFVWNVVNRLGNAFGFELRKGQLHSGTRSLHRFGYRFPAFLTGRVNGEPGGPAGVLAAVLAGSNGSAHTTPELRAAAANGDPLPQDWQQYVTQVRDHSYELTDADIRKLQSSGHTDDEIFELTVAAAVGAADRALTAGVRALG